MPRRRTAVLLATAALALALPIGPAPAEAAPRTTPLKLLNQLRLAPETTTAAPSNFAAWGKSAVKKCRNVRAEVLVADAFGAPAKNCSRTGLTWTDPFTGATVRASSKMTVERMVPLEEAWDSGASRWDARTRAAFANDLGYDGSLVAVSTKGAAKRKSREPAQWTPRSNLRCDYVTRWITVKARWGLSVDAREYDALRAAMGPYDCDIRRIPAVNRATVTLPPPPVPLDTRYETCAEMAAAGLGPYLRGRDAEYGWYRDDDGDGTACEAVEGIAVTPSADWRDARVTAHTTPTIAGDAVPVPGPNGSFARGYLRARILLGEAELWRGSSSSAAYDGPVRSSVPVPSGVLTAEGIYTVQTWSSWHSADPVVPATPTSMTFTLDLTPPPPPVVTQNGYSATAVSDAPDLLAFRFSQWDGYAERAARPGEPVSWTAPYMSGPQPPITVRAVDRAGNLS